jgi:two-component system sensor histidine kinase GlrK
MTLKRLFSLKYLAAFGFCLALIPLLIAVVDAAFAVEEVAGSGQAAIYQVLNQSKTIGLVIRRVKEVERKAKYFSLLSEPSLRDPYERQSYEGVRTSLEQALEELRHLEVDKNLVSYINQLTEKERLIYQQVVGSQTADNHGLPVEEAFRSLHGLADDLRRVIAEQVEREVSELQEHSTSVRQRLLMQLSILLPVSVALIVILTTLFSRVIRQLDASIRRLGAGDFMEPIRVAGPQDLRYLGERLEWLRTRRLALEQSRQEFLHNFSGEIKTPLVAIGKGSQLLADEAVGELNPKQRDIAQKLTGGMQELQALIEDIIRYSRFSADSLKHPKEVVNMEALVKSVIRDSQARLADKSLKIKELIQKIEVAGVPERLRTLVDELISNAVKFSPMGGEIRVILRASGSNMELEVEDDGPGIDANERSRVFEPFFRGRAANTLEAKGSGMGLAIAGECVASHQGMIEVVEPRQDKQGARILVQIPLLEKSE